MWWLQNIMNVPDATESYILKWLILLCEFHLIKKKNQKKKNTSWVILVCS